MSGYYREIKTDCPGLLWGKVVKKDKKIKFLWHLSAATHLWGDVLVICVVVPVDPVVTVHQGEGKDVHLCPQRLGSLCYDTCDLFHLGQLHLEPLVHVTMLKRGSGEKRAERGASLQGWCSHALLKSQFGLSLGATWIKTDWFFLL